MTDQDGYWTTSFQRRYSRRRFLGAVAGVGASYAGLSLFGCTGEKASPEPSGTAAAKMPKYGGILKWSNPTGLPQLDPYDVAGRSPQRAALGVIYDWLVDYDWTGGLTSADGKLIPRLAESWASPDESTVVFKLRQGVKWHDGKEFSSADVKFSYEFNMDPQNGLPGRSVLDAASKVEAPDSNTVKITLKRPAAGFISLLQNDALPIAPKHLLEKDRTGLSMKPIGTGPFMVEKFDPNTGVTFKKNPNFWVSGRPYLDGMVMALITDWSAKAAAFMSKEIDINIVNDRTQWESIEPAARDAQLRKFPGVGINTCVFNYPKTPFNDVRVRRAVLLGIDHKGVLDMIFSGEGTINPPVISGNWKSWAIPQDEFLKMPGYRQPKDADVTEAKRLLAEAGYASGLKVTTIAIAEGSAPKFLEVFADQMRKVGITVDQQPIERTTHTKRAQAGDFDIAIVPYGSFSEDPDRRLFQFVHSKGATNYGKLSDPKLDGMIEMQSRTSNVAERRKLIQDIQRHMIDQAYHVGTPDGLYFGMMQPYVKGYDPAYIGVTHPHPRASAQDLWLDK